VAAEHVAAVALNQTQTALDAARHDARHVQADEEETAREAAEAGYLKNATQQSVNDGTGALISANWSLQAGSNAYNHTAHNLEVVQGMVAETEGQLTGLEHQVDEEARHLAIFGTASKDAHTAHSTAKDAHKAASTALEAARVTKTIVGHALQQGKVMREQARDTLNSARSDLAGATMESAMAKEAKKEADSALKTASNLSGKIKGYSAEAKESVHRASADVAKGDAMLVEADASKKAAEEDSHEAHKMVEDMQGEVAAVKADHDEAVAAMGEAEEAHKAAEKDFEETKKSQEETKKAVEGAGTATRAARTALDDVEKVKNEGVAERKEAQASAGEAAAAVGGARKAQEITQAALAEAETSQSDAKVSKEAADDAVKDSQASQVEAREAYGEAQAAMTAASQGVGAAQSALHGVEAEAGKIAGLAASMKGEEDRTKQIEGLLEFLYSQSNQNTQNTWALSNTTSTVEHAVDSLNKTRSTQTKILENVAKHTMVDEMIMKALGTREIHSQKMMAMLDGNSKTAKGSLTSIEHQQSAIASTIEGMSGAEKRNKAIINAQEAVQHGLQSTIGAVESIQDTQSKTIKTVESNGGVLKHTLNVVALNQKTMQGTINTVESGVAVQEKTLDVVKAHTGTLSKAVEVLQHQHDADKNTIDALHKMQLADDAQLEGYNAHAAVDKSSLEAIARAQETDNKLIGTVEKTQLAQSQTLDTVQQHEKAMGGTLDALHETNNAVGAHLTAVEETQVAQGSILNAAGKGAEGIKAVLGAVQQNQVTDEGILNNVKAASTLSHTEAVALQSAMGGFDARLSGLSETEKHDQAMLAQLHGSDNHLGAQVHALSSTEELLTTSEANHRAAIGLLGTRQNEVKQVQNRHHDALVKLAQAAHVGVGYLEDVANKAVKNERSLEDASHQLGMHEHDLVDMSQAEHGQNAHLQQLKGHEEHIGEQVYTLEQGAIHDQTAMELEKKAQAHIEGAATAIAAQGQEHLHEVERLNNDILGDGKGGVPIGADYPGLKGELAEAKDELKDVEHDQNRLNGTVENLAHTQEEDEKHVLDNINGVSNSISTAAHDGQQIQDAMEEEGNAMNMANQTMEQNAAEVDRAKADLDKAAGKASALDGESKDQEAQMRNESQELTKLTQDAASTAQMAEDGHKEVENLEAHAGAVQDKLAHEQGLANDIINKAAPEFKEKLAHVEDEEESVRQKQADQVDEMNNIVKKTTFKIQKLAAAATQGKPTAEESLKEVEQAEKSNQEQLQGVNEGVAGQTDAINNINDKNLKSEQNEKDLEAHEKKIVQNDEAIEENENTVAGKIHFLSAAFVLVVVGFAILHNRWREKITQIEKEKGPEWDPLVA